MNIKNIKNLIYKSSLIILLIQFSLVGIYIFDHRTRIRNKLRTFITYFEQSFDTLNPKDYFDYFQDIFSSFVSIKQLDRVDLSLSLNDKKKLECLRIRKKDCTKTKWVKAELINKNEIFPIKVRAKGDRPIHRRNFDTMSFKIDIRGDKRFRGMEEFSLQSPIIRNYTFEPMAARALRSEGIISPKHEYIRLYINGKYSGIRHLEESFAKELIERSKKRYGPIFSLNEIQNTIYENNSFELQDKKFWDKLNSDLPEKTLSVLRSSQKNNKVFNKYFDTEKWAKYIAMMDTLFMFHGILPKSVKFYMNPVTGLIEPIFFDGHHVKGIWGGDFRFSDMLIATNRLDSKICKILCSNKYFYKMILGDEDNINQLFYDHYLTYMEKYSSEEFYVSTLKKEWDNLWLERGMIYREFFKRDALAYEGLLPHVGTLSNLKKRTKSIREDVKSNKTITPIHGFSNYQNSIIIENLNSKLPQKYLLFCEGNKLLDQFILVKGKKINSKNLASYNCNFDSLQFSIDNGKNKIFINKMILDDFDFRQKIIGSSNKNLNNNKNYIFDANLTEIKNNLLIKNMEVIFTESSNICLTNNANLHIINSKINIEGTKGNPVIIEACSDNSGGSFIVDNSEVNIGYLEVNNLNSPDFQLRNLFGGINIINSKVNGKQINISNSKSEDAFNLIDSSLNLDHLELNNILSDGIDSDFSSFNINTLSCDFIGNDCIDISFSKGTINYIYSNNVNDKAVSTGESSILNIKNVLIDNSEIGIVVKDNSDIKIDFYKYNNVKVPLASYIKKNEFGAPFLSINKIEGENFSKEFISSESLVTIEDKKILGSNSSKIISNKFYGKIYGVKTIR